MTTKSDEQLKTMDIISLLIDRTFIESNDKREPTKESDNHIELGIELKNIKTYEDFSIFYDKIDTYPITDILYILHEYLIEHTIIKEK